MLFDEPMVKESPNRTKAIRERIGRPDGDKKVDEFEIKTEESNVSAEDVKII